MRAWRPTLCRARTLIIGIGASIILIGPSISLAAVAPPELNSEIRILVVRSQFVSEAIVAQQVQFLSDSWASIEQSSAVSLAFANGGVALVYPDDPFANPPKELEGDGFTQRNLIKEYVTQSTDPNDPDSPSLREIHGADIVIAFSISVSVPGLGPVCGLAPQDNWIGPNASFNGDHSGLDLDGRDNFFVGLVSTSSFAACTSPGTNLLAHEFGHLLGAGHVYNLPDRGLYADSRGDYRILVNPSRPWFRWAFATALIAPGDDACLIATQPSNGKCSLDRHYSDSLYYSNTNFDGRNDKALNKTALSVANYVQGTPTPPIDTCIDGIDNDGDGDVDSSDPECSGNDGESGPSPTPPPNCNSTVAPTNVQGWLVAQCAVTNGITWSHYNVEWRHGCPQQVTEYEIWYEQPTTAPAVFGWTRLERYSDVFVEGAPSRIRVRACGPAGCSNFALSSFVAVDQC